MGGSSDPGDRDEAPAAGGDRGEDDIEESLHEALSDLEQILQRHEGARGEPAAAPEPEDAHQYDIPLLDEVVIPGVPVAHARDAGRGDAHDEHRELDEDEPALRRRLAARLASEIEVIVQDRMEIALERARAEIAAQVRNHMDIILPEIVDELAPARRRDE